MGSANVNDRSMLGDRDSEVALRIEDTVHVTSRMVATWHHLASCTFICVSTSFLWRHQYLILVLFVALQNGKPWSAGALPHAFRKRLMATHLGDTTSDLTDPLCDEVVCHIDVIYCFTFLAVDAVGIATCPQGSL